MLNQVGVLQILRTNPGTSIQDAGRFGFVQYGVPNSGVLDTVSFHWINHILRNSADSAVLEILQPGFVGTFSHPTQIALAGALANVKLNGTSIQPGLIRIHTGDVLEIGKFERGQALYLGIKNGFLSPEVMRSKSWYQGVTPESQGLAGQKLSYPVSAEKISDQYAFSKWNLDWSNTKTISVYPGPEWELLDRKTQERLLGGPFTVSNLRNRMAIQLEELLPHSLGEMPTAPVFPGAVQLTSGGKIIVLMRDAGVTGGYPRIFQLPELSIAILAQKKPQAKVHFQLIDNT